MHTIVNRIVTSVVVLSTLWPIAVSAHGERAQQANTRMRTVNWYDVTMSPKKVMVGERVIVRGRIRNSNFWPEHIPSVEGRAFLNIAASGPNFIREASSIDGVSMVQSTSLQLGRDYEFEFVLKARRPGRYHVHPILNVLDSGGMVGPGYWIEVDGSESDFTNETQTMFGRTVNLETFNLDVVYTWHAIWFFIGGCWLFYWFRRRPLLVARMREVDAAEAAGLDPDTILTTRDRNVAIGFFVLTLIVIILGFQWAEARHPVTTPLRTAKVNVPEKPKATSVIELKLEEAFYRIPGRSFQMSLVLKNTGTKTFKVGEFLTANLRFMNPAVRTLKPEDSHDLVASDGLRVEGGAIAPGETKSIKVFAEDALWETQRLTHMINDPDSIIAGLLFFYAEDGSREIVEVGGPMLPLFE